MNNFCEPYNDMVQWCWDTRNGDTRNEFQFFQKICAVGYKERLLNFFETQRDEVQKHKTDLKFIFVLQKKSVIWLCFIVKFRSGSSGINSISSTNRRIASLFLQIRKTTVFDALTLYSRKTASLIWVRLLFFSLSLTMNRLTSRVKKFLSFAMINVIECICWQGITYEIRYFVW